MLKPDQIPSTGRKASFLIKQLGFESIDSFTASLPKGSTIADIGAGLSRLGHEVAGTRPDIQWLNIDPCYARTKILDVAKQGLPSNVKLLSEDIVMGSSALTELKGTMDTVYSYWLLPHLSLENDSAAQSAAGNMYDLLRPGGKMVVGPKPKLGRGFLSLWLYKATVTHTKNENRNEVVADVVKQTKLRRLPRIIHLLSNRYNLHLGLRFVGGKTKRR